MVLSLADVQANAQDDIDYNLINELRRGSPFLLDALVFDDVVVPGTGGGTLTTGYTRQVNTRPAHTRQVNTEYPAFEVKRERKTVDLVPLGARYNLDRVIARLGATSEVAFQQLEAVDATVKKFNDLFINGEAGRDFDSASPEFEGIDSIITGTVTEWTDNGQAFDFDTFASKADALKATQQLRAWLRKFDGRPDVFLVNDDGAAWLDIVNDWINYSSAVTTSFGQEIPTYGNIPYVNLGTKATIVNQADILSGATEEDDVIATSADGVTSIYGVRFGLDSVHGVCTPGNLFFQSLPDFTSTGAVKAGEVELGPVAVVAKKTRGAGAFRVKVR